MKRFARDSYLLLLDLTGACDPRPGLTPLLIGTSRPG